VLLAAHHGSRNSNSIGFLNAATPEALIVYAGLNNRYGHPNQESIDRINSVGVNHIFITYEDGTITLTTNGETAYNTVASRLPISLQYGHKWY